MSILEGDFYTNLNFKGDITVENRKQIYNFVIKWRDKFRDQNINYIELVDHWMADDCAALGFEMDCGHAFFEKYGRAANNFEALKKIIDEVTDIPLLGSAIYSRQRYFNHWAYSGEEILESQNREQFILIFSRLALLSEENPFLFQGMLKKLRIVSNNIRYGPMPERDDEEEQHLTINDKGRVWFAGYHFGNAGEQYKKARTKNFKIEKTSAEKLLDAFATYFGNEYMEAFATDIGSWVMELTNTEKITYKFYGSLCANFDHKCTDLSDLVHNTVGMNDLYVFDGNNKPDVINRITLEYHRVTKSGPKEMTKSEIWKYTTGDYTEHLVIDRATETLEHILNIGESYKVSHKYEIAGGIKNLLESFDANILFSHIKGNPKEVIDTPDETKDYKITIDYEKNPQCILQGSYDKNGLPKDFADFAKTVFDFVRSYGMGEILDPSVYGKVKRRKSEYIFCSVIFDKGCKSYYYLTDDDSIEIGDFVLVPAGKDNHTAVVEVVNIEYFSEKNVPLSVEKTKRIICKCKDKDSGLPDK